MEVIVAALAPAAALLVIARFCGDDFRRAVQRWFVPLTLLVFAPYWLTDRIPAPLDFLGAQIVPWMRPGVVVRNALQSDVVTQMLPWREVVTDFWRHGELPIVNPFSGCGTALWANPQAAVLHPLTLLGLPFSTFTWAMFAALARVLTALTGMFVFLRGEGRSEEASVVGAIAFGLCASHIAFLLFPMTNVTTLLPWMLAAIQRRNGRACAIVTALLFLGGHPESVLHVAMLAIPYALFVARGSVTRYAQAAVTGLLIAAPVVVPFLILMPQSERAAHPIGSTPFAFAQLLPFVFPARFAYGPFAVPGANFNEFATQYAGFAAFVLCIHAVKQTRFWTVMLAALTVAAFLPGGFVQMGRVRFVIAFVIATMAAHGFDLDCDRRLKLLAAIAAAIVLVAAIVFWPRAVELHLAGVVAATTIAAIVSAIVLIVRPRLVAFALFADLAILMLVSLPPHGRGEFYPETGAIRFLRSQPGRFRIAGVSGSVFPNTSSMFRIADIRVHDPMAPEKYLQLLQRGGLDRHGYFEVFHGFPARPLANALGVRYIVAPPGSTSPLPAAYRGSDAVVFFNAEARDIPAEPTQKPAGWAPGWIAAAIGITLLLLPVWRFAITRSSSASAARMLYLCIDGLRLDVSLKIRSWSRWHSSVGRAADL
jgi:hypothetical protein